MTARRLDTLVLALCAVALAFVSVRLAEAPAVQVGPFTMLGWSNGLCALALLVAVLLAITPED